MPEFTAVPQLRPSTAAQPNRVAEIAAWLAAAASVRITPVADAGAVMISPLIYAEFFWSPPYPLTGEEERMPHSSLVVHRCPVP